LVLSIEAIQLLGYVFSHNPLTKIPYDSSTCLRTLFYHTSPILNRNGFSARLYNLVSLVREYRYSFPEIFVRAKIYAIFKVSPYVGIKLEFLQLFLESCWGFNFNVLNSTHPSLFEHRIVLSHCRQGVYFRVG